MGRESAGVHLVSLQYERRVSVPGFRAARLAEIDQPDLPPTNHRLFRFFRFRLSRTTAFVRLRARTAAGSSPG
jgi:hypothetical protein